jgi:hypothetical protein
MQVVLKEFFVDRIINASAMLKLYLACLAFGDVVLKNRSRVVDTAFCYGLGGSGFESRWGPLALILNGHRGSFPELKRPGHEINGYGE